MTSPAIQLELGLPVIQSYKRLSYTPWHAIAELVDNATQSYFNKREQLDEAFLSTGESLCIGIVYEREGAGMLRVSDNAMGMSYDELTNALKVGFPPENTAGEVQVWHGLENRVVLDRQQMDRAHQKVGGDDRASRDCRCRHDSKRRQTTFSILP